MKVKYFPKIYFVCVILILVVSMLVLVSCDDKKTNEKAVEPATAWEEIQEGFDKTAGASGYEVEFKTKSKSTFGEYSSEDSATYNISLYGIGTDSFRASAVTKNSETLTKKSYYFEADKFYVADIEGEKNTTPYLYVSDDVDALKEVTGLNVFKINTEAVKTALESSKSVVEGEEGDCKYIKFAMTSQNAVDILGDSYQIYNDMKDFDGYMFFYTNSEGYLVKFGYDSNYAETYEGEKTAVELSVEYNFMNINKATEIAAPGWVTKLAPEEIDTVYYIKDKVLYSFLYEPSENSSGYGYKLYWIESMVDKDKVVEYAQIPEEINGIKVVDISRTAFSFGKGVKVLVMPQTISYVAYPAEGVEMTVFSKCEEFTENVPEGVTAYTAQEWDFIDGVPTVKK